MRLTLAPEVVHEIRELTELLVERNEDDEVSFEVRYLLGWLHWFRSEALPQGQDAHDLNAALAMFLPIFISHPGAESITPEQLLPVLAERATPTAIDLLRRAAGSSEPLLTDAAAGVRQRTIDAVPADDPQLLDAVVGVWQRIVDAVPAESPAHPAILTNLGVALNIRFARSGAREDLEDAIQALRAAVDATAAGSPDRAGRLFNLGNALESRFERFGAVQDLDEAINVFRAEVAARPGDDPASALRLSDLGSKLRARFARAGALQDIGEAINVLRAAVDAAPTESPARPAILSEFGAALGTRFERSGAPEDLESAIEAGRAAVDAALGDGPGRAAILSALGATLGIRHQRFGAVQDLDEAINLFRAAVAASPHDDPDHAVMLSNLGNALGVRYERFGAVQDLDEAINLFRAAVAASPDDEPIRAGSLWNLGLGLEARFEHSGAVADVQDAVSQYVLAAGVQYAAPVRRIRAARAAAALSGQSESHRMAGVLETAVGLLPEVAARHLERGDQQYALGALAGLASDAAALALSDTHLPEHQRAARALRLLEAGRAVLLSQALDTRRDVTDLRDQHPELARRYTDLRDLLDQPYDSDGPRVDLADSLTVDRRALVGEFQAVLDQIRTQPGFASFARLPSTEELLIHAAAGPVVSFNVSAYRSDALLMITSGMSTISLPRLNIDTLQVQITSFHDALRIAGHARVSSSERKRAQEALREVLAWLWEVAAEPVLDALGYHEPPSDGEWPRVWWATGGMLGLLPLHAAGHHAPGSAGQSVMDRVVSSYTPTIRALDYARQKSVTFQSSATVENDRSLIVAMPTTPGQRALPFAAEEAALLTARLPTPVLLTEPDVHLAGRLTGVIPEPPTRAAVFEELSRCSIAHFACHGTHDSADPSRSHLLLRDHATAPLTIASLAPVRLDRARLAYLSACRTAFHGTELIDEAIHLTAAFQLAGFPHVIGTLWEISDPIAVTLAGTFYSHLRANGDRTAVDTDRTAEALHHAVRALRDQHPNLPSLWAAYVHAGA